MLKPEVCSLTAGLLALFVVGACAGGSSGPRPVPTLASSASAATAFEAIREAWRDPDLTSPAALRARIEQFIAQYPDDGLVPLARVYLALVALDRGDFGAADRQISLGESLPAGSTRDLWTVARARRARLRGQPEAALELLRPLVGKTVDPITRTQFEQELTLAALGTHREYEAISYMDAWLRASTEEEKPRTVRAVSGIVEKLPRDVLVGALQAMRTQRTSFGYGVDIERILAEQLVRIATTSGDAELARILLDPDAGALVVAGDAGVELGELATSRRGLNVVEGRTIGLLLPTESPALRDESADVLRGVMWALGLPNGVRTLSRGRAATAESGRKVETPRASAVRPQGPSPCVAAEAAPALDEPRPEDQVRLATRDDAGSTDRTEVALDELAGEGAAIIVAGLDAVTATRALRWAENHSVTVVALVPPAEAMPTQGFAFVLGEPRAAVVDMLARAVPSLASDSVAPVLDASELGSVAPQGGRLGPMTLLPAVSCDVVTTRAGDPRFPVTQWGKDRARAWLVSGSPTCARDVVGELSTARVRGVVALTLEAATTTVRPEGLRVVSASAGIVPDRTGSDAQDDELRRFEATLGTVGWWTALGRDAATLARVAARQLPTGTASEAREVAERRTRARDLFAASRAHLWSTETTGWSDHAMARTLCAVDASK
jgi:hypothetical protein